MRPGPGMALDGKPKFDLNQFNQVYFDRMRSRVTAARDRGIYVSIMLFQGWSTETSAAWQGHPFNIHNNVNGVDGDPNKNGTGEAVHTLQLTAITNLQQAYVRQVIDTVNDLDNVLYEIANETGNYTTDWQYYMIRYIKSYEASKPKQHPVGMTFQWSSLGNGSDAALFDSPADWISPAGALPPYDWATNPPPADGSKVMLSDTDHIGGQNRVWVWKSFLRGHNPIVMDDLGHADPMREAVRHAMGHTLTYAHRMDLMSMVPRTDLASSTYCLANPGVEYLVYLPSDSHWMESWLASKRFLWRFGPLVSRLSRWFMGLFRLTVTVDLTAASGGLSLEWFNPSTGKVVAGGRTMGGASRSFRAPFRGDAVLYIAGSQTTP